MSNPPQPANHPESTGPFAEYLAVLAKIDAKFSDIVQRHPSAFACQVGCHACCQPGLTVSSVEAARIRAAVAADPALQEALRWLADHPQWRSADGVATRCDLLGPDGRCSIYAVRPALCRTHGAPTWVRQPDGQTLRDVCSLNFAGIDLQELDAVDGMDLATVSTLLFVVGQRYAQKAGVDGQKRIPLQPQVLLPTAS
jgi:hypothetical protein